MIVAPGQSFEATVYGVPTGLVGTIGVRIMDGVGGTTTARTTSGIIESPAGSGVYTVPLTAPTVAGEYVIVWDQGGALTPSTTTAQHLAVTSSVAALTAPPRATMAGLVTRLRLAIADPAGAAQVFTDAQLQDFLDRRRIDVPGMELHAVRAPAAGASQYRDFFDPYFGGNWEDDETLHDSTFAPITPSAADRLTGHWTFAASQTPPVYVVGKTYDLNGGAADALVVWAAREKVAFDIVADDARLSRSQKHMMLRQQADDFAARARMPLPAGRLRRMAIR